MRWHLLMSRTAFKRDIDDWKTVSDFVDRVQSPEWLRMLLILTNVDIRAVGPTSGTPGRAVCSTSSTTALSKNRDGERTARRPPDDAGGERQIQAARATGRLGQRNARGLHFARPLRLLARLHHGRAGASLRTDAESRGGSQGAVRRGAVGTVAPRHRNDGYAPDHPGLFAQIAGAMSLSGASIVGAKVVTLANSMALDVFHIQDLAGLPFDSEDRLKRLADRIDAPSPAAPAGPRTAEHAVARAAESDAGLQGAAPRHLRQQGLGGHTVIEVNGDRLGFLHDVTSTLTAQGLQIVSAHISTAERVVDVFYGRTSSA